MKFISTIFALLSLSAPSLAQNATLPPNLPFAGKAGLTYLYTVNCTLGTAITVGQTPLANRKIIPIIGGVFSGPRINGTVLNLGADWGATDVNGMFHPDTRYHLRTNDGAEIYIRTKGPKQPNNHIYLNIEFETAHPDYYWLNYVMAVGILTSAPKGGYVMIDAWQLDLC